MKKKTIKIGFPMEYEDDDHVCHYGTFLRENETKAVEEKLQELQRKDNNWNELKEFIENELNHNVDKEKSFMGYQCKIILDKIKELEENKR